MKDKLLYDLEYKVNELRKDYINKVKYEDLTLKDVLDLGFNNTYIFINDDIGYVRFYKDLDNNYLCEDYYFKEEDILNSKVKYEYSEYGDENYLELTVSFIDDKQHKLFEDYLNKTRIFI